MRDNITGKSILIIGDPFYGYCNYIREQLLLLGAKSVLFVETPFYTGSFRDNINLQTLISWVNDPMIRTHWTEKLINNLGSEKFDTLFVVQKMPFKKFFIDHLRYLNPHIRTILFLWDTFHTQQSRYIDYLPKFDKVYTFDKDDAVKYNLSYYPDFYIEAGTVDGSCKYDVAFVGTMDANDTSHRGNILAEINNLCIQEGLNTFFYLRYYNLQKTKGYFKRILKRIRFWKYYRNINKLKKFGFLHHSALPLCDYNRLMSNTKAVLDISHRNRQGMTINAITALAMGKKLITTNKRIQEEPFFNPQMICIIDEKNPIFDVEFLKTPCYTMDMSYLRIDNWLKHVVNEME